jgi:hypothetical protein
LLGTRGVLSGSGNRGGGSDDGVGGLDEVLVSLAVPTEVLYEVAVELSDMSKEVIKGKGMLV